MANGSQNAQGTSNKTTGRIVTSQAARAAGPCPCKTETSPKLEWLEAMRQKIGDGDRKAVDEFLDTQEGQQVVQGWIARIQARPTTAADDGVMSGGSVGMLGVRQLTRAVGGDAAVLRLDQEIAGAARGLAGVASRFAFGVADLAKMVVNHNPLNPLNTVRDSLDLAILQEHIALGNICLECVQHEAKAMGKELAKPVTEPWSKGEYTEAIVAGGAELAMLLGPIVAKLGSVRAASAAARAAEAAEVAKSGTAVKSAEPAQAGGKKGAVITAKQKPAEGASSTSGETPTQKAAEKPAEKAPDDSTSSKTDSESTKSTNTESDTTAAPGDRDPATVGCNDRTCVSDPIDVVTGEMVMQHTDVSLPATLALELRRVHISGYTRGRLFGREWASSWDQRIEVDGSTLRFFVDDGSVLPFSAHGIAPTRSPNNVDWTLRRTPAGYAVDHRDGRTLSFATTSLAIARLTEITEPGGQRITLGYDRTGTLERVTHSGGYIVRVHTEHGRIVALHLVDPDDGREHMLAQYAYDDAGHGARLVSHATDGGSALTYAYDAAGRIVRWQDRRGTWFGYQYDERGRCVATSGVDGILADRFHYDAARRLTMYTDALGHSTTYHYNALLQVTQVTDALGAITRTERDAQDRVLRETDPLGRTTSFDYDERGNLERIVRADGNRYGFEYDEANRCTRVVDPLSTVRTRRYDARGLPTETTLPDGSTFTLSHEGTLHRLTDPAGAVSITETDARGLIIASTDANGATTRLTRDAFGRVTARIDPLGHVERFAYSPTGQLTHIVDANGAEQRWSYDMEGVLAEHVDALGCRTRIETTWFDQTAAVIGPDGATTRCEYDALLRLTRVTDALKRQWTYERDAVGRVVAETDFNARRIAYAYDAAGQCIGQKNALGEATRIAYDLLGRVVRREASDTSSRFEYDAAGRLVAAISADAQVQFKRDVLGRVVEESCNGRAVRSTYDTAGRRTLRSIAGDSTREADNPIDSRWHFDAAGLPLTLALPGDDIFRFTHDARGLETSRRFASRSSELRLEQRFDATGRLVQQSALGGRDRLIQQRDWQYDPAGQLRQLADRRFGVTRFERDAAGRVTQMNRPQAAERYAYDLAGQIIDAARQKAGFAAPTSNDGVDEAALAQGPRQYEGTRLSRAGEVTYIHDAQGRVTERRMALPLGASKRWHYTWDTDDRLRSVVTPDATEWRYAYDAFGRRIRKSQWSTLATPTGPQPIELQSTQFVWDGANMAQELHIERRYHADGGEADYRRKVVTTTWEWEPGSFRALARTVCKSERGYTQHSRHAVINDAIGTPCELVGADSIVAWQTKRTLWGEVDDQPINDTDCSWGFQGQYHDEETGLAYNFHRYYDPQTGRYQSSDPIKMAGGFDPHGYVGDPTGWLDPFGLQKQDAKIGSGQAHASLAQNVRLYPDGSLRTPDGKFASVAGQPSPGTINAANYADFLRSNGVNVVGTELEVIGPLGIRKYDIGTRSLDGSVFGIEIKSGGARLDSYQDFSDRFINEFGAVGRGRIAGQPVRGSMTIFLPSGG